MTNNSPQISVEINVNEDKWLEELPEVLDLIEDVCAYVVRATDIISVTEIIEISVLLTHDKEIRKLNKDYRKKNKPTNVLSFPGEELIAGNYNGINPHLYLGDIAISFETIKAEAEEQSKNFKDHFIHMLVHGCIHLLGYDHIEDYDAEIMEDLEVNILKGLGINNPYI